MIAVMVASMTVLTSLGLMTDSTGRLRSDIVYFYDSTVKEADIESDFSLLSRNGLMSMSQLHHTESMLNRGPRTPRGG